MKKIEVKVMTRGDIQAAITDLTEKISALEGKTLNDFDKWCFEHDKKLLAKYSKIVETYSWKDVFYFVDERMVNIVFEDYHERKEDGTD